MYDLVCDKLLKARYRVRVRFCGNLDAAEGRHGARGFDDGADVGGDGRGGRRVGFGVGRCGGFSGVLVEHPGDELAPPFAGATVGVLQDFCEGGDVAVAGAGEEVEGLAGFVRVGGGGDGLVAEAVQDMGGYVLSRRGVWEVGGGAEEGSKEVAGGRGVRNRHDDVLGGGDAFCRKRGLLGNAWGGYGCIVAVWLFSIC